MFNITTEIKKLLKLFTRTDVLVFAALIAGFFLTRLIRLDKFPIFTDEGIYIHWSKVAWHDASMRFVSLTDGRQPLQTWATIPFLKLFETNMLLGGRLFAVASGLFAMIGVITTTWYLFGKKAAKIAGFLYVLTPYFLFYDRMALVDSVVNGFTIWMFLFSIVLARTLRLDVAMILGGIAGFALLGKSSVRLYFGLTFLAVTFIIFHEFGNKKRQIIEFFKHLFESKKALAEKLLSFGFLYGVALSIALLIYHVQMLSPYLHYVAEKNKTFVLTFSELLQNPFALIFHNLPLIPYYISSEMAYVVAIFALIGLYKMFKEQRVTATYIILWFVMPWVALSLIAKVLFPRYVLPLGGLMLLPAAYFLSKLNKKHFMFAITLFILSVSYFNYTILFDHKNIPFPAIDRGQYLEGWPAGWGIKEIVDFARERSAVKPVILIAEGNFGMSGDVLDTHVRPGDAITIKPYWPLDLPQLLENQTFTQDYEVYVVFSHRKEFPTEWPIDLVETYPKVTSDPSIAPEAIYLYKLRSL